MADNTAPVWWIELIKVSPGLIAAGIAVGVLIVYRTEMRALFGRMTAFKALGIEASFASKTLDDAIAQQKVAVSADDRTGALKRLRSVAPLLRDTRLLWVDDNPSSTRNERALLEGLGVRITTVTTSAEAERELRDHLYLLVITDLQREGKALEGLEFVGRTVASKTYVWTIAYVGSDQWGRPRPAHLFGITNRPDQLMHLVCDVVERERL